MSVKEAVLQELDTLPASKMSEVLEFIRFLKVKLVSEAEIEGQFSQAVAKARSIADELGITDRDIDEEVAAHRAGR
jgi:hypothetical protein